MQFTIINMHEQIARKILSWKYDKPYDFYNNDVTEDGIRELLNGTYKAISKDNRIFGFFCTGKSAQVPVGHTYGVYEGDCVDIGLGMNPDYTGQGYGYSFCTYIVNYIGNKHTGNPIRLSVATFNKRAIHVYEQLGFIKKDTFRAASTEFFTMIKEAYKP